MRRFAAVNRRSRNSDYCNAAASKRKISRLNRRLFVPSFVYFTPTLPTPVRTILLQNHASRRMSATSQLAYSRICSPVATASKAREFVKAMAENLSRFMADEFAGGVLVARAMALNPSQAKIAHAHFVRKPSRNEIASFADALSTAVSATGIEPRTWRSRGRTLRRANL